MQFFLSKFPSLSVKDRGPSPRREGEQGQTVPDGVWQRVVAGVGAEAVDVDQQLIRLVELLQGQVELFDDRGPVVTRKLFVCLTNDIVDDVVWALDGDLDPAAGGDGGPGREDGVVDERVVLPR